MKHSQTKKGDIEIMPSMTVSLYRSDTQEF